MVDLLFKQAISFIPRLSGSGKREEEEEEEKKGLDVFF